MLTKRHQKKALAPPKRKKRLQKLQAQTAEADDDVNGCYSNQVQRVKEEEENSCLPKAVDHQIRNYICDTKVKVGLYKLSVGSFRKYIRKLLVDLLLENMAYNISSLD